MKILIYCQYVLGVGHLMRSFNIAQHLSKRHKVCMLCGGEQIDEITKQSPFRIEWLEPIRSDGSKPGYSFASVIQRRLKKINKRVDKLKPDIFWIEGFPFARRKFAREILPSIDYVKQVNPQCKIISSVRDILLGTSYDEAYKRKVVEDLNTYMDLLFVHGDYNFFPFEKTFGDMSTIKCPHKYTGYICRSVVKDTDKLLWNNNGHITVNIGGSKLGEFILYKVLECHQQYFPDRAVHIFLNIDGDGVNVKSKINSKNVYIHPFSFDYINCLKTAALSISMAGYNSVIESVITSTPSVVIPFDDNEEQIIRAQLFDEKFNLFEIVKSKELTPQTLFNAIGRAVEKKRTSAKVDFNGLAYLMNYFDGLSTGVSND